MEHIIKVPDIGSSNAVDVIEILVKVGDRIEIDTPLLTLESDKASMEIPSSEAGIVKAILVKLGDKVNMGDTILTIETARLEEETTEPLTPIPSQEVTISVPDIGTSNPVDVIEILVKVGDHVEVDTPLVTLESNKASMELPSPQSGTVEKIIVQVGDQVQQGNAILMLSSSKAPEVAVQPIPKIAEEQPSIPKKDKEPEVITEITPSLEGILAGPSARRMARILGVDLSKIQGTGKKSRIQVEDIETYVKNRLQQPEQGQSMGLNLPVAEEIDFSVFGPIEMQPLSKIKKLSGQNLHRAWLQIPHVTQFDEADITDLEAFRKQQGPTFEAQGLKLTILAFIAKAASKALQVYPQFNASLSADGSQLIIKKYIHIGIAVDTPQGLVVPVLKNVDQMSIKDIVQAMTELSQKARKKALLPNDMTGGTFTISSLGGIGGTAFTPIVNHPEVAILGVSKSSLKPLYQNHQFIPRLMLPLSLSYDHRVIDGAQGARFTGYLSELLSDIRKIML